MKLINKFTLVYIVVTLVVLLIGGVILFKGILYEVDREAEVKLNAWIRITARQIEEGLPVEKLEDENYVMITELDYDAPLVPYTKVDSMGIFPPKLVGLDRKLTISQSFRINGKHYYISTFSFITEPDEVVEGLEKSLLTISLILVVFIGITSIVISRSILSPFNKTLEAMRSFSLKQQKLIQLPETRTSEFKVLNHFLAKMTGKALDDYRTLKEFSENASHEIQTPLAVIRGKLELLMTTNINEEQASYISSMQNAVQKLSSLNQSLLLLTKLENLEYEPAGEVDISKIARNTLSTFGELMEMKSISCTEEVKEGVNILINPFLAEILLSNLISNAIRHNNAGGYIHFSLTAKSMRVENTGNAPEVPPQELFKRFKKSNQSSDSTGLGLSIVKQICDINNFDVSYIYEDNLHKIEVRFEKPA